MSEEIKQKAREELRELFPLEYLRNEIDNFGYASLENWIDDLLSQALQKRDEAIIEEVEKLIVVAHSHKLHCENYSECREFTNFETTHNRAVTQVLGLLKKNISTLNTK